MKYLVIFIIVLIIQNVYSYGESDSEGNPNFLERESFNLINLVRMFPTNYKNEYMTGMTNLEKILSPNTYPAVKPVYYLNGLNRLAKAHSYDMKVSNCFSHSDCNGTNTWKRFDSFLPCSSNSYRAENIAKGTATGIRTNNLLICEASSACFVDGTNDGHRKNIMGANYATIGVGEYQTLWTQDFLSQGLCASGITTPIYSGYHTFFPSTTPLFIVNFFHATLVSSKMEIVFGDGTITAMTLKYGTTSKGIYTLSKAVASCTPYYFKSTSTSGTTTRYPETGYLQTASNSNSASCKGWVSSISTTTSSTTGTTTSKPSTTGSTTGTTTAKPSTTGSSTSSGQGGEDSSEPSNSNVLKSITFSSLIVLISAIVLIL